ncbi:MAG: RNA polymerase sigma factor RpoD/SigA [Chitinophagales bacterium]
MRKLTITTKFTNRDSIALEKYLGELSKETVIERDEEEALVKRISKGDLLAMEMLIKANLRFVVSVAKQYEGFGLRLEDLISEGNIGLMKAAKRFDGTRGIKFISYAVFWIRQSIMKSINENARIIRLPHNQLTQINKINKAISKLEQNTEYQADPEDIAQEIGVKSSDVRDSLAYAGKTQSADSPVGDQEGTTFMELIKNENSIVPDSEMLMNSKNEEIQMLLRHLSPREIKILTLSYGLGGRDAMDLKDIAEEIGVGRERVRQLKVKSLAKLRRICKRENVSALFAEM